MGFGFGFELVAPVNDVGSGSLVDLTVGRLCLVVGLGRDVFV